MSHRRRWKESQRRGGVAGCRAVGQGPGSLDRWKVGVTGGSVGVVTRDVRDSCRVGRGRVETGSPGSPGSKKPANA
jgi:hypothetical protein